MKPSHSKRIHITSYPNAEAEGVASQMRRFFNCSDRSHTLVEDPGEAELIFIGGIGNEMGQAEYIERTIDNRLIDKYPDNSFTVSYRDDPVILNRGVYESPVKSTWNFGRCLAGSYGLSGTFNTKVVASADHDKDLLFSFVGRASHECRRRLLKQSFHRKDVLMEDSSTFNYWNCTPELRKTREQYYASTLARSKFSICPRGAGTGSIRLFEALRAGVAPVIISDDWIFPPQIPWESFSVILKESEMAHLESVLEKNEIQSHVMGARARSCWENYFSDGSYFTYLVNGCVAMKRRQLLPEKFYWSTRRAMLWTRNFRSKASRRVQGLRRRINPVDANSAN